MAGTALIIGGGIGGMTTAIALSRAGWDVRLFEAAETIREVGAGITVQANAMTALAAIDLADAVRERGHLFDVGFLGDMWGRRLTSYEFGPLREALPQPSVALARPVLLHILRDAVPDAAVCTGKRCTGYEARVDGVTALFDDGTEASGDVLIGCDGIHSAVRKQLLGDTPTRYAGYTCWRGLVDIGELWDPRLFGEMWGRGTRFGVGPIGEGTLYWFAVANAPEGVRFDDDKKAVSITFEDWFSGVRDIIAATPADAILHNDIIDRPPVDTWGEGRVTLLGDAAHPTTPNMGQGACMAIEDAIVLANRLRDADDPATALRAYEDARRDRANAITKQSLMIGAIAHWSNPLLCFFRDWGAWMSPTSLTTREMLKVWDWEDSV